MRNETVTPCHVPATLVEDSAELSPFVLEFFMVEGLGFRGMAYCDQNGNWRNAFNHDQLMGHIYLVE